jgi:hypothetical protein
MNYIAYSKEDGFPYKMTDKGFMDEFLYTKNFAEVKDKTIKFAEELQDIDYNKAIAQGMEYNDILVNITPEFRADYSELKNNADLISYPFTCYNLTFDNKEQLISFYNTGFAYVLNLKMECQNKKNNLKNLSEEDLINIIFN